MNTMTEVSVPGLWDYKNDNWEILVCSLDEIKGVSEHNSRKKEPDRELDELVVSYNELGTNTMPIILDEKNEIICGQRRYLAAKKAGLKSVVCLRKKMSTKEKRIRSFLENELQLDLDDADRYELARYLTKEEGMTLEQIAKVVGRSPTTIHRWLQYDQIPEAIKHTEAEEKYRKTTDRQRQLITEILESKPLKEHPSVAVKFATEAAEMTHRGLENVIKDVKSGIIDDQHLEKKLFNHVNKDKDVKVRKLDYEQYTLRFYRGFTNRMANVAKIVYPDKNLDEVISTILYEWVERKEKETGIAK